VHNFLSYHWNFKLFTFAGTRYIKFKEIYIIKIAIGNLSLGRPFQVSGIHFCSFSLEYKLRVLHIDYRLIRCQKTRVGRVFLNSKSVDRFVQELIPATILSVWRHSYFGIHIKFAAHVKVFFCENYFFNICITNVCQEMRQ
jgi:hypothetical protein